MKARIDRALKDVPEYYKEKALVMEVLREKDRQARRELASPPKVGAKVAA